MRGLRQVDLERLLKIMEFLEAELADAEKYRQLTSALYRQDSDKRRSVERWIENIVNASLDLAKVMVVAMDKPIPDTYKEYFIVASDLGVIDMEMAEKLAEGVKIRNVLAHQYLDVKWDNIAKFISEKYLVYIDWLAVTKKFIQAA